MTKPISYKRHRFPPKIIAHAVWLYFRFPLRLRLVEEMLLARGIVVPYETVPAAEVIVPPRSSAVLSEMAESAPTQRDRHLRSIAEHGRMGWQKRSGYTRRALVETAIRRFKQVIGDALRSRTDGRRTIEVAIAISALNRMLELERPDSGRVA